uniref:Uncharacterized protein n=1 Tax=Amblyomma maculatum TaxID=34609 RepID=G3MKQ9_AMBMU
MGAQGPRWRQASTPHYTSCPCGGKVLSSPEDLFLYLAPPRGWYTGNSKCLKSRLVAVKEGGKEIVRTIEFYRAELNQGSFGPVLFVVTMRVVKRPGDTVIIEALETSNGEKFPPESETKPNKNPEIHKKVPRREPRSLDETANLYLPGVNKLPVLFASNTCVVIGGSEENANQGCTLWTTASSVKLPARCCKFTFLSQCYRQGYQAYENDTSLFASGNDTNKVVVKGRWLCTCGLVPKKWIENKLQNKERKE